MSDYTPFKMKGSPMHRNFGVGKGKAGAGIAKSQAPPTDPTPNPGKLPGKNPGKTPLKGFLGKLLNPAQMLPGKLGELAGKLPGSNL